MRLIDVQLEFFIEAVVYELYQLVNYLEVRNLCCSHNCYGVLAGLAAVRCVIYSIFLGV